MSSSFEQLGVMLLVFVLALIPGLFSRRMERSDYVTVVTIPIVAFPFAVLPGILTWGFNKNSATYVMGVIVVIVVATLNYRFQPKQSTATEVPSNTSTATAAAVKEG
jgi:hypothetical protein